MHVDDFGGELDRAQWRAPPRAATIGMWIFLAALAVFFVGSLIAFFWIRAYSSASPAAGTIVVPRALWLSTAILMLSGYTMETALRAVRRERQRRFRAGLLATFLLGLLFLAVQGPAMLALLQSQLDSAVALYSFIFVLIVLHALHVVGGLIPLGIMSLRAFRDRYDHEVHDSVKYTAMYWHFLDGVWLALFTSFLVAA